MRRGRNRAWAAAGAVALVLLVGRTADVSAGGAGFGPRCDEYDPASPAASARITLDSTDAVNSRGDEMASFIDTGSIGRVDVSVVSSSPPGVVLGVTALPEISHFSPYYGEELKGIAVAVALGGSRRPAKVVVDLRQVCAKHFRNTFLYY